ncbi:MAG: hypothetical protein E3J64_09705 [Anaerolineales bacterium]|nr:MAG: hypothetical protein E3J64_09705 [Anaerolineales bacterium]
MAGKSSGISVVARAAPGSKKRTIQLRRNPIRISTKDDDTTCDLFTVAWDSLGEVMGLGMDFFVHRGEGDRRWDVGFAVAARIVPIHHTSPASKTVSALQQLKETRLWRQIGYWRSRDVADGPVRDIAKETDEAAEECSARLVGRIRVRGADGFPDDDFLRQMKQDDVLFVPPIPADMGILDWHRHAELVRNAYWWGLEEVQRLKRARHPLIAAVEATATAR